VKKALRHRLHETLAAIPPETRHAKSVAVCERLLETPEYRLARTVMIFLSTPTEVDTSGIALDAWRRDKRVAAPRVSFEQRRMAAIEIDSLSSGLHTIALGVREPIDGQLIPPGELDLVFVPGLAFDEQGNRLGRGQGFYDRFLSQPAFAGVSCAVAFEEQVLPAVPHEEHDVRVRMLVTDRRVLRF
jgi:5-formyltetrahydrofolate cyclo-ligase